MRQSNQAQIEEVDTELVDLPGTKLRVSRVALGTWAMGGWMWGAGPTSANRSRRSGQPLDQAST